MITFDGERSKGRKWFAEKQLRVAKDLDIPGKTVQWEGFTFRVWQDGELSGGRVTAPMGIAVMRVNSEPKAADFMIAESWEAGFNKIGPIKAVIWDGSGSVLFDRPEEVPAGYRSVPYVTRDMYSYAGVSAIGPYRDLCSVPSMMPLGEGIFVSLSSSAFVDENGNGTPDSNKQVVDSSLILYSEDGGRMVKRSGFSHNLTDTSVFPNYTVFTLATDGFKQVVSNVSSFWNTGDTLLSHQLITLHPNTFQYVSCETMWDGADESLVVDLTDPSNFGYATAFGRYAFYHEADVVLLGTALESSFGTPSSSLISSYPDWHCFYTIRRGAVNSVINASQFSALLELKASASLSTTEKRKVFEQFFGWPNCSWRCAYDSAMFHGHDGNIYSWTRRYGSVKFTDAGLFDGGVTVPVDCATDGVRPEITHAGDGVYLCVCNHVGSHITGVFVGSPFGTWIRLADPSAAFELLTVRPVSATYTVDTDTYSATMIGVAKRIATEEQPEAHFACIYRDGWLMLGQLPQHMERNEEDMLEPVAYDGWETYSICFFGDGPIVGGLMSYPSRPHTLPLMPRSDNYSDYAVGLP